ncbi:uncharacterized protein CC84DRAFT_1228221 [Paraphaeosphaeria sporulosa]|uniref:Tat pathway signal sequence n=1 Tax=Paraphaeosphaeria sporulosa TaxID=1460663 RepID=A0A177D0G7_9PLEO|nr:uncharacterized protein CC84DRAFT_1228221 [Paraphaeosphaeria sporulosa]OAG13184.1 hypothetical protein CC84DRAFT_1228221 [Paraphaeosphaeria sporulosa]
MKFLLAQGYQRVEQEQSSEKSSRTSLEGFDTSGSPIASRRMIWYRWLPWVLVAILTITNCYAWMATRSTHFPESIFSPATSAIKYKTVIFQAGIDSDTSPYQGKPSQEIDHEWEELHKYGVSRIPMSDAAQLANRTSPIPGDEGHYVVILEVFHQLHCLQHVRRRLFWNETEQGSPDEVEALSMKHLDHCIDSIRQSLMCSADVTPLPYVWWRKYDQLMPATAVAHTCRDFEAIRDWAKEHRAGKVDKHTQVYDPLGDQVVYDV